MNDNDIRHDKRCRLCEGNQITTVFRLMDTPLEDQFVSHEKLAIPQPLYPLELAICETCGYLHLPHIVSPQASYADYAYVSGVTVGLRGHYDDYAKEIVGDFGIREGELVIDLGSNDGSMLASFKKLGMRVLGVEPASKIADQANAQGLPTINSFFTDETAAHILENHGDAKVVTANYMYANIDDMIGFTKAVSKLLASDGIFVVQTGYHPEQMKIKMFDYIYHEHFSYFTVEVLKELFARCGLEPIDAQKRTPKGGSLRIVSQLEDRTRATDASVEAIIQEERQAGMRKAETYRQFALQIDESKNKLRNALSEIQNSGKRIVGFGASHSTTTLIYHFELSPFLEYLVDDNEIKHGLFSPGHHLPVYPSQKLYTETPDYVLILAWQHHDSIVTRHKRYLEAGGKFLLPLPELRIISMPEHQQAP